ncbi:MAG: minor capsid protein [Fusobacteriaceae bacterium]
MFPEKQEIKLRSRINKNTSNIYEYIEFLVNNEETKFNQSDFDDIINKDIDKFIDDLVDSTIEFAKFNQEEWKKVLGKTIPSPLNKDSTEKFLMENLEYYRGTPQRAIDKMEKIRYNRIEDFTRELNTTFEARIEVPNLKDIEYLKVNLQNTKFDFKEWEGLRKDVLNIDKYTKGDLQGLKDWFMRRNELWARNEAGNLYSMQSEELAVIMGIEKFKWITENDSRVRKSHQSNNGKIFDFYGVEFLPGQEPLCRCHLEPIKNK